MFTRQQHSMENMTAVWLLPIVAAEVTAASGGLLIPYLADSAQAVRILIFSYVLWAISVPLAFSVLAILFLRLGCIACRIRIWPCRAGSVWARLAPAHWD